MRITRRAFATGLAAASVSGRAAAQTAPVDVLSAWWGLILKLVRHTPTLSPPVASRAFAYIATASYEAIAQDEPGYASLAGQLKDLTPIPQRPAGDGLLPSFVLHGVLSSMAKLTFANTGPTGQRAIEAMTSKLAAKLMKDGVPGATARHSLDHGGTIARHIAEWSFGDGGHEIENLGFPVSYELGTAPGHWVPTSTIALQQAPLLPKWGWNRPFAMPASDACPLPPPPAYDERPGSAFYLEAKAVFDASKTLTAEQKFIARFWSDDPMLSPTPPGHWISIALQLFEQLGTPLAQRADVLARLGIAVADAFIACWRSKYEFDLLRPVTYIRKIIDPAWEPLLITPPFPEYPSGHSTQSGAAAAVLTSVFGEDFAFRDATHERDGLEPRSYPSFWAAAEEAALSRFYGGIHFQSAIDRGLEQGRCVGAHANALKTRG